MENYAEIMGYRFSAKIGIKLWRGANEEDDDREFKGQKSKGEIKCDVCSTVDRHLNFHGEEKSPVFVTLTRNIHYSSRNLDIWKLFFYEYMVN